MDSLPNDRLPLGRTTSVWHPPGEAGTILKDLRPAGEAEGLRLGRNLSVCTE